MAYLNEDFKTRIFERVNEDSGLLLDIMEEVAGEPRHRGKEWSFVCPHCGTGALKVTPGKMIYKCFSCNEVAGKNAINFLMGPGSGLSLQDAVERVCQHYHIAPEYEEPVRRKRSASPPKKKDDPAAEPESFCSRMLRESGLTRADVTARVRLVLNDSEAREVQTFKKGTINDRYEIDPDGDDAVIYYYDIEGNPCMFTFSPKGHKPVERPYWRVRYQFPDAHKDKNGRPVKYRSPFGSPTFIYYPETIREAYRSRSEIPVLFIQEGEKKAEKACKHGIPSVAISGIQNLGGPDKKLPDNLIKVIRECKVKQVVFLMDSDLHDLSRNLTETDPVDRRPGNFFHAVCKYKSYMNELVNQNIYVEVYYGHVAKNDAGDKGVDDLLTNTLKGKEDDLAKDIDFALHENLLKGKYVELFNITEVSTTRIKKQFFLESPQVFCKQYIDQLKPLRQFVCMGWKYRINEKGELESASPVERDEQFWEKDATRKGEPLKFVYTHAMTFLERRGFHVYDISDDNFLLVRVENGVVRAVTARKVGNFIHEFTRAYLTEDVRELLLRGGTQYIGPYQLEQLEPFRGVFYEPQRGLDYMFFKDRFWKISEDRIEEGAIGDIRFNIWQDSIHDFTDIPVLPPMVEISRAEDGAFSASLTETGRQCHFLRFLENTSNFSWRKRKPSDEDLADNAQHFVSRLSALGYLACTHKDMGMAKAVIGMDGKQQEFDEANGRSGKSLFGLALKKIFPRNKSLDGKALGVSNTNRQFIWEGVDERTRIVIGDDLMKDFDFDSLFSLTTGDWPVNPKNKTAYLVPFSKSPKIYLSSNYAISGDGDSYEARQWLLAFSDFYNKDHQPAQDFGCLFFEEWETDQWTYFWNLVAQCIQIFFRYGFIPLPDNRLEERRLAQQIGEDFMGWADEFFAPDAGHLNSRILRADMFRNFIEYLQAQRGGAKVSYSSKGFSKRLGYYVKLRGLYLNPHKFDPRTGKWLDRDKDGREIRRDTTNGKEYYVIGDADYYRTYQPAEDAPLPPELALFGPSEAQEEDMPC